MSTVKCSTLTGDRTQSQYEGYKDAQENRRNGVAAGVDSKSIFRGHGISCKDSKSMHNSGGMNAMETQLDVLAKAGLEPVN